MTYNLQDRVALVTGSSRGIGRAVAERLAGCGASVILTARGEDRLLAVRKGIEERGGEARAVAGDLTAEGFVEGLFDTIQREHGGIDIVVNNAGLAPSGPIQELAVEELRACLELNIVSVFRCMQQAVRLMEETGRGGKIINIGSVRSHWTEAGDGGAYNASKYGLRGMTESVARQLQGTGCGIAVGMVCPGVVDTRLTNPAREPRPDWLRPEDVAEAVLHAVSAPGRVNAFDTVLFSTSQEPW